MKPQQDCRKIWEGWNLFALLAALLALYAAGVFAMHPDALGARMVIRATARTSLLLFSLAFSAGALAGLRSSLHPGERSEASGWLLRNRRMLGLAFAFSHLLHACGIAAFARLDPAGFHSATGLANYLGGGLAYVFIAAMAASSFDGAAAWLGRARWTWLHAVGAHVIWLVFVVSFGKRLSQGPFYAAALALLVLVMALRVAARLRLRRVAG